MPRVKARYNRERSFAQKIKAGGSEEPHSVSNELRSQLRDFCAQDREQDVFVEELVREVYWAKSELERIESSLTRAEVIAEMGDLANRLIAARDGLRTLSWDVDSRLGPDADPLGSADVVDKLIAQIGEALATAKELPAEEFGSNQTRETIAVELATRVGDVAMQYGINFSATGTPGDAESFSDGVRLMVLVGRAAGLDYELSTWRNHIAKAKAQRNVAL
jgi:hypothetical protein